MTEAKHTPTVGSKTEWKLVPVNLTEDMAPELESAFGTQECWELLLAAAPEPPAHDDAVVERVAKAIYSRSYADWDRLPAWVREESIANARAAIAAMPAQSPSLNEAAEVLREAQIFLNVGASYAPNTADSIAFHWAGEHFELRGLADVMREVAERSGALLSKLEGGK